MGFDANIALGVKPVEIENPLNALAKAMQVQKMQQDMEIGRVGLEDKVRLQGQKSKLSQLVASGIDASTPEGQQALYAQAPDLADAHIKATSEYKKNFGQGASAQATADKIGEENKSREFVKAAYDIYNHASPTSARQSILQSAQSGKLDPAWVQKNLSELDKIDQYEDPAQAQGAFKAWQDSHVVPMLKKALVDGGHYDQALSYEAPKAGVTLQQTSADQRAADALALREKLAKEKAAAKPAAAGPVSSADIPETIKAIANGEMELRAPTSNARNPNARADYEKTVAAVKAINPSWTADMYGTIKKTQGSFGAGADAKTMKAINTAIDHLDTWKELGLALKNGDVQVINKAKNFLGIQAGASAAEVSDLASDIVAKEVVKGIVGGGGAGGVEERHAMEQRIKATLKSPGQIEATYKTAVKLLSGQLKGMEQQYTAGTYGRKDFRDRYLNEASRRAFAEESNAPADIEALLKRYGK